MHRQIVTKRHSIILGAPFSLDNTKDCIVTYENKQSVFEKTTITKGKSAGFLSHINVKSRKTP
jgi:hypothetical protein